MIVADEYADKLLYIEYADFNTSNNFPGHCLQAGLSSLIDMHLHWALFRGDYADVQRHCEALILWHQSICWPSSTAQRALNLLGWRLFAFPTKQNTDPVAQTTPPDSPEKQHP